MAAAAPIMIGISALGGILSFMSAQDAASSQEKIARENALQQEMAAEMNARRVRRETEEEERRMKMEQERTEAGTRARAAASGVTLSGSITDYLEEMTSEHGKQREWLRESGESRAEEYLWAGRTGAAITRAEGKSRAKATRMGGYGALIGAFGDAYGYGKGTYW